jgi:hypothetical protein
MSLIRARYLPFRMLEASRSWNPLHIYPLMNGGAAMQLAHPGVFSRVHDSVEISL